MENLNMGCKALGQVKQLMSTLRITSKISLPHQNVNVHVPRILRLDPYSINNGSNKSITFQKLTSVFNNLSPSNFLLNENDENNSKKTRKEIT